MSERGISRHGRYYPADGVSKRESMPPKTAFTTTSCDHRTPLRAAGAGVNLR